MNDAWSPRYAGVRLNWPWLILLSFPHLYGSCAQCSRTVPSRHCACPAWDRSAWNLSDWGQPAATSAVTTERLASYLRSRHSIYDYVGYREWDTRAASQRASACHPSSRGTLSGRHHGRRNLGRRNLGRRNLGRRNLGRRNLGRRQPPNGYRTCPPGDSL